MGDECSRIQIVIVKMLLALPLETIKTIIIQFNNSTFQVWHMRKFGSVIWTSWLFMNRVPITNLAAGEQNKTCDECLDFQSSTKTPQPFCLLRINPKEIMVAISWEHIPVIQNTMKIEETRSTDS